MKMFRIVAPLALVGALSAYAAVAGAHGDRAHGDHVCRADVERLCGEARYNRGAIADCLDQHAADLSPDCQKRVAMMKARMEQFHQACDADLQKLCATADRGPSTFRCLRDHGGDLSEACKSELAEARTHHRHGKHGDGAPPRAGAPSGS